jgi:hypothetical protein
MTYKLVYRNARTDNRGWLETTYNFTEEQLKIRDDYVRLIENLAVEYNTKRVSYTANNIAILSYDFDTESKAREFRVRLKEIRDATGYSNIMFIRDQSMAANTGNVKTSILLYKDDELIDTILHTTFDKS